MKALTLCADDFAQSPAISAAILELIASQRIAATSVMSQSPLWPSLAGELAGLADAADIGLHFNLTHPFSADARPLSYWLLKSPAGLVSRSAMRDGLLKQIDRFTEHFQRLPDFIDGHQHVHALPVIRGALFEAVSLRWQDGERPYLRAPDRLGHPGDSWLKALLLKGLSTGFARQADSRGFATAPWFAGLYSLSAQTNFAELMRRWLALCPDGSLLMCHPGQAARDRADPIGAVRALEYGYLSSQRFAEDCQRNAVVIRRFSKPHRPQEGKPRMGH
ncbi:MAG: ChbG/HpnK family deacetylase [Pseudomonas sp.]